MELQSLYLIILGGNITLISSDFNKGRYGLLTSTLFLDALTNPNTSFEEADIFRTIYDDLYREINDPLVGAPAIDQLIKSLSLRFSTTTAIGEYLRGRLGNDGPFIERMIEELDQIILDRSANLGTENIDDSYTRISRALLFLTDNALLDDLYSLPFFMAVYGIYPKQEFRDALFNALYYRPSSWEKFSFAFRCEC